MKNKDITRKLIFKELIRQISARIINQKKREVIKSIRVKGYNTNSRRLKIYNKIEIW